MNPYTKEKPKMGLSLETCPTAPHVSVSAVSELCPEPVGLEYVGFKTWVQL